MAKSEEVIDIGTDPKVARDVAEQDFTRFLTMMGIQIDTSDLNDDEKSTFAENRNRIVDCMMRGSIVVNQIGQILFTPERSENNKEITFYEPTGSALMQMDRKQKDHDVAKMYNLMAAITKEHPSRFTNLMMNDVRVCMAVASLFLA